MIERSSPPIIAAVLALAFAAGCSTETVERKPSEVICGKIYDECTGFVFKLPDKNDKTKFNRVDKAGCAAHYEDYIKRSAPYVQTLATCMATVACGCARETCYERTTCSADGGPSAADAGR